MGVEKTAGLLIALVVVAGVAPAVAGEPADDARCSIMSWYQGRRSPMGDHEMQLGIYDPVCIHSVERGTHRFVVVDRTKKNFYGARMPFGYVEFMAEESRLDSCSSEIEPLPVRMWVSYITGYYVGTGPTGPAVIDCLCQRDGGTVVVSTPTTTPASTMHFVVGLSAPLDN